MTSGGRVGQERLEKVLQQTLHVRRARRGDGGGEEEAGRGERGLLQQDGVSGELENVERYAQALRGKGQVHERDILARERARCGEDKDARRQTGRCAARARGGGDGTVCRGELICRGGVWPGVGGGCGGGGRCGEGELVGVGEGEGECTGEEGGVCRGEFFSGRASEEVAQVGEDRVFDLAEGEVFVRVGRLLGRGRGGGGRGGVEPAGALAVRGDDGDAVLVVEGEVGVYED